MEHDAESSKRYKENWDDAVLASTADAAEIAELKEAYALLFKDNALLRQVHTDFRRECGDTDAILRVLGLDPVNCRTDGGSLKLVMLLGALEHRDVMLKREARRKEIERCADVIARKTHLPVTGDWDAGYVAGRDDAIVAIRITASNAALDDECPTGKCADPARDCYGSGCLSDEPQSAVAAAMGEKA